MSLQANDSVGTGKRFGFSLNKFRDPADDSTSTGKKPHPEIGCLIN